ncbi:MAG TPA: DUF488 domain-containing protein, partial [Pyrinomonadaceae bacterium]|nr:DUF488 domain-containing protein [Pyrinomonadaceae bacterium]
AHKITRLVDVRRLPKSRRFPHFNRERLDEELSAIAIVYLPLPELGGLRQLKSDSRNTALHNASFRAYADYMETPEFEEGVARLIQSALGGRTAIMCAEALWRRCHRSLISDYLTSKGHLIRHIMDETQEHPHSYTDAARIVEGRLSYEGLFAERRS